ncbi:complement C1q tumor necrosis factor-related protein 8-like [Ursus maritimus]|uniref:Complement C1q tumor necrosis factor-related protein 8-like n=1 Tax=Ursus maritimus TaxID=29073 RepID=A0A8M1GEJ3_URSMA|nr:complement C1q tumor necrosis factor-related protein 8-like [Ursus maritimus]
MMASPQSFPSSPAPDRVPDRPQTMPWHRRWPEDLGPPWQGHAAPAALGGRRAGWVADSKALCAAGPGVLKLARGLLVLDGPGEGAGAWGEHERALSRAFRAVTPDTARQAGSGTRLRNGEKGEPGLRGLSGRNGKEGPLGARGLWGHKGQKGQAGPPGPLCQRAYAAFSVGRREGLHSADGFQAVPFDTELVNPDGAFHLASGRFLCAVPGIYFLNLNVHTWNYKETYLHIMWNGRATAVLYAQPGERSIMQTQSLLLPLATGDTVWVRMFQRDRDNAIYGEHGDLSITFNGHLVKPGSVSDVCRGWG